MDRETKQLADLIHGELCGRNKPCGYGQSGNRHNDYYEGRAHRLRERLEAKISDVLFAVETVLSELW